jgi:acetylornithine deacetylase/succinyl-diaminopimelate desuccinylase-like protein
MHGKKFCNRVAGALAILALALPAVAADAQFDWKALEEEAVVNLSRYLQVNTTNPPGNEIEAARFLKQIFERDGIETRIIESAPGRGNVFARLRGDGSKKAVMLLHHMDVVPADPKEWKEPPFSGSIKNGEIWGRGALDNKGPAVAELMTLLALKRQKVALKGDVIFLGSADEEAGGAMGAGYLLEKHPELFAGVGIVLNEGGGIRLGKDGKVREYSIGTAEKTPLWLRLTARGQPGHGSSPGSNLAVNKLIAALQRIAQYQAPIKVVPEVQRFYAQIAHSEPEERRKKLLDLRASLEDQMFAAEFTKEARDNASVRNTIAITVMKASEKTNVIPAQATAELDARLLPGEDPQAFIKELRRVMKDDSIKIEVVLSFPPATSPPHPEALRVISDMARRNDGGVPVVSPLGRGFTDCRFFRAKSIPCFGFMPLRNSASEGGMVHGIDERITIDSLRAGIRGMYELVHKLAVE